MDEGFRTRGSTEYRDRTATQVRPDRIAFWALMLAVVAMIAGAASARAGSGGVDGSGGSSGGGKESSYAATYDGFSSHDKRWARKTSDCESGGDPKAVSPDGRYRGAFQFMKKTWRTSPSSPGGDPIRYRWKTQAVVAVKLKHREGTNPWPNCG
jgi:hypothetical protein